MESEAQPPLRRIRSSSSSRRGIDDADWHWHRPLFAPPPAGTPAAGSAGPPTPTVGDSSSMTQRALGLLAVGFDATYH